MSPRRRLMKRRRSFSDVFTDEDDDDESLENSSLSSVPRSTVVRTQHWPSQQTWPPVILLEQPMTERQQLAALQKMTAYESKERCSGSIRCAPPAHGKRRWSGVKKVNRKNARGDAPMHMAAKKGNLNRIKALLDKGADVNIQCYAGWTPLHEACLVGSVCVMEALLKAGADVNIASNDNVTPLHDAVTSGCFEAVQLLLQYGANPAVKNSQGKTPLDLATTAEAKNILRIHLEKGSHYAKTSDNFNAKRKKEIFPIPSDVAALPRDASLQFLPFDYAMPALMGNISGDMAALTTQSTHSVAYQNPQRVYFAYHAMPHGLAVPVAVTANGAKTTIPKDVRYRAAAFSLTGAENGASVNKENRWKTDVVDFGESGIVNDGPGFDSFSSFAEYKPLCDGEGLTSEDFSLVLPKCGEFQGVGNYEEVSSSSDVSRIQDEQAPQRRNFPAGNIVQNSEMTSIVPPPSASSLNPQVPSSETGFNNGAMISPCNKFVISYYPSHLKHQANAPLPLIEYVLPKQEISPAFGQSLCCQNETFGSQTVSHSILKSLSESCLQTGDKSDRSKHARAFSDCKISTNMYSARPLLIAMDEALAGGIKMRNLAPVILSDKSKHVQVMQDVKLHPKPKRSRLNLRCEELLMTGRSSESTIGHVAMFPNVADSRENPANAIGFGPPATEIGNSLAGGKKICERFSKCLEKIGSRTKNIKTNSKGLKTGRRREDKSLNSVGDVKKWSRTGEIQSVDVQLKGAAPADDGVTLDLDQNKMLFSLARILPVKTLDHKKVGSPNPCDLNLASLKYSKWNLSGVEPQVSSQSKVHKRLRRHFKSRMKEDSVITSTDNVIGTLSTTSVFPIGSFASDNDCADQRTEVTAQISGASSDQSNMASSYAMSFDKGTMTGHADWDLAKPEVTHEANCSTSSLSMSRLVAKVPGGSPDLNENYIQNKFTTTPQCDREKCSEDVTPLTVDCAQGGPNGCQEFALFQDGSAACAINSQLCSMPGTSGAFDCSSSVQTLNFAAPSLALQSHNNLRQLAHIATLMSLTTDRSLLIPLISECDVPVPSAFSLKLSASPFSESHRLSSTNNNVDPSWLNNGPGVHEDNIVLTSTKSKQPDEVLGRRSCDVSEQFGRRFVNLKNKRYIKTKNLGKCEMASGDVESDSSSEDNSFTPTTLKLSSSIGNGKRRPLGNIWQKDDPTSSTRRSSESDQETKKDYVLWHGLCDRKASVLDSKFFENKKKKDSLGDRMEQKCLKEFENFLTFTGNYNLCARNSFSGAEFAVPVDLDLPLKDLYIKQEKERRSLLQQHCKERERLVLTAEAEIMRVCASEEMRSCIISCCFFLSEQHGCLESIKENKQRNSSENHINSMKCRRQFQSCMMNIFEKFQKYELDVLFHHRSEADVLYFHQLNEWDLQQKLCHSFHPAFISSPLVWKVSDPDHFISDVFKAVNFDCAEK